ncbi:hypothetical protein B7R87_13700 [Streptomyces tsukubensis]|uniref:Uncharacterized protein n=1 Tax=Streptomyces tsukubensis (strain DSM 42081 / NBRC 108919 / NRRL 18488 / 9993) TaxID=1114943 RepID=I2N0Q9_STRT9|nr:hypothetical protein B7R87_13700 [Streptomyces tsukubensis]EIF90606.1 hypothetical protein [Streptomyces tsukubensis NRRL18488]QKM69115.1 hypothetical protein STSU_020070 [Streptomyces tsukubensis NRRL18488]
MPVVVTAPAAHAAVSSVTTTVDGKLAVGLPSNAIWVKASVLASTQPDAAVLLEDEQLADDGSNTWTSREALKLPDGTAFGNYPVRVDYRLPGGTLQQQTIGTFAYLKRAKVATVAFDRTSTDLNNPVTVLSGTATTFDPSTGTTGPARQGMPVQVRVKVDREWPTKPVTLEYRPEVDAQGKFSVNVAPEGRITGGEAYLETGVTDTVAHPAAALPSVWAEKTKVRIQADSDKRRVHKGQAFTVKGRVEKLTNEGWKPYADAPVLSSLSAPWYWDSYAKTPLGTGKSAADGSFSYTAKATFSGELYTYVRPSAHVPSDAADTGAIAVPEKITLGSPAYSIDAFGTVTASARVYGADCSGESVAFQYSPDGRTWYNMTGVTAGHYTTNECRVSLQTEGYVRGYYRFFHIESDRFVAASAAPKFLSRYLTRFVGHKYSTTRPKINGSMTVSGTVQRQVNGKWIAHPGAKVMVLVKPKGQDQWYWSVKGKTNSKGVYSLKAPVYSDGTWAAVTEPMNGYFYSETKDTYIDAR